MKRFMARTVLIVSIAIVSSATLRAQATRTWVSGVGDDVNPCSRTAPCKTFAGAISKTAAGGEIDVLDPGGFGAVSITKSIAIENDGALAGVLVSGTNGIVVSAAASDVVTIRGLILEGLDTSLSGINFTSGGSLHVENCTIEGFNVGISFAPSATSSLYVKDTIIRKNTTTGGGGVLVKPGTSGRADVSFDHVRLEGNFFGFRGEDRTTANIRDSISNGNATNGFLAFSGAGGTVQINLESCVSANNGASGVSANGAAATVRISNVTVTNNTTGLNSVNGATIASFQNNRIGGNTTNGAPNSILTQQ